MDRHHRQQDPDSNDEHDDHGGHYNLVEEQDHTNIPMSDGSSQLKKQTEELEFQECQESLPSESSEEYFERNNKALQAELARNFLAKESLFSKGWQPAESAKCICAGNMAKMRPFYLDEQGGLLLGIFDG